jgi:hypothetical protein
MFKIFTTFARSHTIYNNLWQFLYSLLRQLWALTRCGAPEEYERCRARCKEVAALVTPTGPDPPG